MFKYKTAYFCANAKLSTQVATPVVNGCLTLGLLIDLETELIEDVSISLNSDLARRIVREYFYGKRVLKDSAQIYEEITMRHRGVAAKAITKAFRDIQQNYISYVHTYSDGQASSEPEKD